MTRLEKCELLKSKGYTYNPETGEIYGARGFKIKNINKRGYVVISGSTHFKGMLLGHHFAWYWVYGNVDFDMLDHINRIKSDNRICNLEISTPQLNQLNTDAKGFYKNGNKWVAIIGINNKVVWLGTFNTKAEAQNAYLNAKKEVIEKHPLKNNI